MPEATHNPIGTAVEEGQVATTGIENLSQSTTTAYIESSSTTNFPLPTGWKEQTMPGGWSYYVDQITGAIRLARPTGRRQAFLLSHPSNSTVQPKKESDEEVQRALLTKILSIYSTKSERSSLIRHAWDGVLKDLPDPDVQGYTFANQSSLPEGRMEELMGHHLGIILNPTRRMKLDHHMLRPGHLQNNEFIQITILEDELELFDSLPLIFDAPGSEDTTVATIGAPDAESGKVGLKHTHLSHITLKQAQAWCHLCTMDFEEPIRKQISEVEQDEEQDEPLPLLRLLQCGHIFHKLCIDTWIYYELAKCPSCLEPIRFPDGATVEQVAGSDDDENDDEDEDEDEDEDDDEDEDEDDDEDDDEEVELEMARSGSPSPISDEQDESGPNLTPQDRPSVDTESPKTETQIPLASIYHPLANDAKQVGALKEIAARLAHGVKQRRQERRDRRQELRIKRQGALNVFPAMLYVPATSLSPTSPAEEATESTSYHREINVANPGLPHLPLEENRAGCYICMMDFEPPNEHVSEGDEGEDMWQELEKVEPLRLLPCGHAFHVSCVDKWIVNESTNCPYCRKDTGIHFSNSSSSNDASSSVSGSSLGLHEFSSDSSSDGEWTTESSSRDSVYSIPPFLFDGPSRGVSPSPPSPASSSLSSPQIELFSLSE